MRFGRLLAFAVGVAHAVGALAHGYLAQPAARNVQHNSDWCPQCLNGGGVCGDPSDGPRNHEAFGKYATQRLAATYASGGTLRARVVITANHLGRWGLRLCALDDDSPAAERRALPDCFERLKRADGGGTWVYLSSSASESSATFRLPKGVRCKRCVLQWRYQTGNSCTPRGTPPRHANPHLQECGTPGAPVMERFTNCADVRIA